MKTFRIHGDNIVECERIANIIIKALSAFVEYAYLSSPSVVVIKLKAEFLGQRIYWNLELLPGFNKNTKKHWDGNIFDSLKEAGSFFDETPDAIISSIEDNEERILLAIEFCSALQAGNHAWQRSARAYSTGRTGCPYLYIVDFVKYELDNNDRTRKNLRFPNAAVPYSYISYTNHTGNFIAQLYLKSEEFDKSKDLSISQFDESNFCSKELGSIIVKLMLSMDISEEKEIVLQKSMDIVKFLSNRSDGSINFTASEWQELYSKTHSDIIGFSIENSRFGFHKTIAEKSRHGHSTEVLNAVKDTSVGLASRDLPFGIIPSDKREEFAKKLSLIYTNADKKVIDGIGKKDKNLVIAIIKGFKPRGDDNRPDRGLTSLIAMLSTSDTEVLTYIYGPIIKTNLNLLDSNPMELSRKNGLWRTILALSDYVVLDSPAIPKPVLSVSRVLNTSSIKQFYATIGAGKPLSPKPVFSCVPVRYGEDDVDTAIHYFFTYILGHFCFEGMCNPPGGDWSGFSVRQGCKEYRWLSLPRVSDVVDGKRPDHILEICGVFDKPLLLTIESKEKSSDLETDVGIKLIKYIEELMKFIPSAQRSILPNCGDWEWGDQLVDFEGFETMSAAAYLKKYAEPSGIVFNKKCELLFVMQPIINDKGNGWEIEIIPSTTRSKAVKHFIIEKSQRSLIFNTVFIIK